MKSLSPLLTNYQLSIKYDSGLYEPNCILEKIKNIADGQLIFFYGGPYGLKEEGANFYKNHFFYPIQRQMKVSQNKKNAWTPSCYLYDLKGWGAFYSSRQGKGTDFDKSVNTINGFDIGHIKAIKSSDFFKWVSSEKNSDMSLAIDKILNRKASCEISEKQSASTNKVAQLFDGKIKEKLLALDQDKIYTTLQYIEGLYLVTRIVEDSLNLRPSEAAINVVLILPNNESTYLYDKYFENDLKTILQQKFGARIDQKMISVTFYSFSFNNINHRPYLAGRKVMTKIEKELLVKNLKVGLIGGAGPMAGSLLFQKITEICQKKYGCHNDADFPYMLLLNKPFANMLQNVSPEQRALLTEQLNDSLDVHSLNKMDVVAIACNTLHEFLDLKKIKSLKNMSFINMIEETKLSIKKRRVAQSIVLCSNTSAKYGLHKRYFDCLYPDKDFQTHIQDCIDKILEGKQGQIDAQKLAKGLNALLTGNSTEDQKKKIGLVLGCTEFSVLDQEFPLARNGLDKRFVVLDTNTIVAEKICHLIFS